MKPVGLEGHKRDFGFIKISHEIIKLHQELYPELTQKMKNNPTAINYYGAFLSILAIEIKRKLTQDERIKILKSFRII